MRRIKYLKAEVGINWSEVKGRFFEFLYNDEKGVGFEVQEYSGRELTAWYFERFFSEEVVLNYFGKEETIKAVRFVKFEFDVRCVSNGLFIISVVNPPRSLRNFVEFLRKVLGDIFSISEIRLDAVDYLFKLETSNDFVIVGVDRVSAKDVVVSSCSKAEIQVSSSKDAYRDVVDFLKDKYFQIKSIKVSVLCDGRKGTVEIVSSGMIVSTESTFNPVSVFSNNMVERAVLENF